MRNRAALLTLLSEGKPDLIVHCAAQPSHDLAAACPFEDFDVNAVGTLNLLEATRRYAPDAVFVHMSTNKVYGDAPNGIQLVELEKRWDYADPAYEHGIPETFRIDQCKHSLFGASKVAADIMVQRVRTVLRHADLLFAGGLSDRPKSLRGGVARFSQLFGQGQPEIRSVPYLWV